MKPWREIAVPHRDVLEGTFQQSEFAADLTAVQTGRATAGRPLIPSRKNGLTLASILAARWNMA